MARYKQTALTINTVISNDADATIRENTRFYDSRTSISTSTGRRLKSCYVKKIQVWNDLGASDVALTMTGGMGSCGASGSSAAAGGSTRLAFFDDNTTDLYTYANAPRKVFECRVSRKSRLVLDFPYTGLKFGRGVRCVSDKSDSCYVTITYRQFS
jgi:hypothetical protein